MMRLELGWLHAFWQRCRSPAAWLALLLGMWATGCGDLRPSLVSSTDRIGNGRGDAERWLSSACVPSRAVRRRSVTHRGGILTRSDRVMGLLSTFGDTPAGGRTPAGLRAWAVSTWRSDNRIHVARNVWRGGGALHLRVDGSPPQDGPTVGAEVVSRQAGITEGTVCAELKTSAEPGTVAGFFYYAGDDSEIDMEWLSSEAAQHWLHLSVHRRHAPAHRHVQRQLGFNPANGFHRYAIDWTAMGVRFYVDGRLLAQLPGPIPTRPGHVIINHWSGRFPKWGGAAPTRDAWLQVRRVAMRVRVADGERVTR